MEKPDHNSKFLAWLDAQLGERGWSDAQLSANAGFSHTVMAKARKGILPGWKACSAIAKALVISPEDVFRMAGLLESIPDEIETLRAFWSELSEEDREEVLDYMRYRIEKRKSFKSKRKLNLETNEHE